MLKSDISPTQRKTAKRTRIVSLSLLIIACILLVNVFKLDFFMYEYYKNKAFDQITTTSTLKAERGKIYDANMNVLATTKTTWRIFVSTRQIQTKAKEDGVDYARMISQGLSTILSIDEGTLYKKITNTKQLDVTIEKAANEDEYNDVVEFLKNNHIESLVLTEAQTSRYYPEGTLAAHVLGFTGSDNQGLYGLEYSYNSTLSGKDGYYTYAKDAAGNSMPGEYSGVSPATDGYSIVTTIDSFVQEELESQLELIRINHSVQNRVTGIVMDTSTGAILAMATSSPFDPNSPFELDAQSIEKLENSNLIEGSNEYKAYKNELMQIMWSNKAVSETYEPGSTFKIITVSAALDLGAVKTSDTFSCNGYHTVGGWRIKCHKTTGHGHGFSLAYGLQMSCNPTMMTIAERIGAENFYSYVEDFGYLEKTGIDLPSEAGTIFHRPESIGSTELATASFGQRFKVSIIRQLTSIAAVANGGRLIEPYIVDKIIDNEGNIISERETVVKRQVISENVAKTVSEILEEGVSGDGGAKNAYVDGYLVAAKTGTSQKFDVLDENGNSYLRIGSTVAYAPSNENGIAVIIVVDEPQSQVKYGSVVAAPYVSNLLSSILPYLDYKSTSERSEYTVGNYIGAGIDTATKALKDNEIRYVVVGAGTVVLDQVPKAGVSVQKSSSTVYLYTEKREDDYVIVPSVVGLSIKEANILLSNSGLNIRISGGLSDKCTSMTVISQDLPMLAKVKRGSVITINVLGTDFED
ncbi:MAG: PASTA domain-containing protein [Clostridia bacterium]|nr:PASTA domain-containing protein [Clostridia bacterium]